MRAVVLVGGFGTRLRPLTLTTPKQMLPVGEHTMLERVVAWLGTHDVDEVVLSLGYRPDVFVDQFPDGRCRGVRLRYAVEPEPLDTGGAIGFAARFAGIDEPFFAVNGDVLTDADLGVLRREHARHGSSATITLTPVEDPSRYGVVDADEDGRVRAFVEKPAPGEEPSNLVNAGQYLLNPDVLDLIPEGVPTSIERVVFPRLVDEGRLYRVVSDAYWVDAGTPASYLAANLDLLSGARGAVEEGVAPSARIDAAASVNRSVLGPRAQVAPGASVRASVIMEGATVGPDAVVDGSLVGPGAVIGPGAEVVGLSVVGDDAEVPAGSRLDGALFPPPDQWESVAAAGR